MLNLKEYSGLFNLSDLIRFNKWFARGICLKIFLLKRNSLKVFTPRYIFILAGYKGKQLKNKYHNKEQNFVKIKCFVEKKPLGTGGALNLIKKKISKNFFLINGDTYLEPNIEYITNKIKLKKTKNLLVF